MKEVKTPETILSVKDLVIHFSTDHGYVQAVRGISFDLYKGETLCIVGESGSGKSVTSKSIMGILAANGRIKGGSIMYEGEDLTKVSEDEFHRIRGHKIGMIFQDPLSSLNPIVRIGKQITEAMLINNSRLKKLYQEKISVELVAYKNALTEKNTVILNAKDNVNFLKVDKIKVAESYVLHHQEVDAKIYDEQKKLLAKITELSGQHQIEFEKMNSELEDLKSVLLEKGEDIKTNQDVLQLKGKIKELNDAFNNQVKTLKLEFRNFKRSLRVEKMEEKRKNKLAVKKIYKEYDLKIKEARKDYYRIKKEANAKYNPVIAQAKLIYIAKTKVAKKEVAEYKAKLKGVYTKELEALNSNFSNKLTEFNREFELEIAKIPAMDDAKIAECKKAHALKLKIAKENHTKDLALAKEKYVKSIKITKKEAKERALKIMAEVGIPQPEKRFRQYPFEFSGGMRQRIVIAIALTADPDILICDEPTTALDVTIQAQILDLINRLKRDRNLSCIFITHDLGVVANMADRVAVMYAGKIVEYGTADEIFYDPRHPYTWALLSSIPDVDSKERLEAIPGTPPNMIYPPKGDAFAIRSRYAMKVDFIKEPPLFKISDTHYAATWLLDPRAPKVDMPTIVKTRIVNSLKAAEAKGGK